MEAVEAIREGHSKALICLGGNLAVAMPDPEVTFPAMRKLKLAVHIATKLNRSHLLIAEQSFILPCLGRTELDMQETGAQSVTVEDSMSMVHASKGRLKPASENLRSEPWIVAELAKAYASEQQDRLAVVRVATTGVFAMPSSRCSRLPRLQRAREAAGRFSSHHSGVIPRVEHAIAPRQLHRVLGEEIDPMASQPGVLMLTTIRSHDQYNTTIYGMDDRYSRHQGPP